MIKKIEYNHLINTLTKLIPSHKENKKEKRTYDYIKEFI
jgi:hypothetical protein